MKQRAIELTLCATKQTPPHPTQNLSYGHMDIDEQMNHL
jgi:hypothetical protein